MARDFSSVRNDQVVGGIAEILRQALDELPLVREKRERDERVLYGHGKVKWKGANNA